MNVCDHFLYILENVSEPEKSPHRTLVQTCILLGNCVFLKPSHTPTPPPLPIQDLSG